MNCTILALKIADVRPGTEETATNALHELVDSALAAAGGSLDSKMIVSIGPTGGVLLAYQDEANASRALRLAEAVVTRSGKPGYAGAKWPIAGVITQGVVREV